MFRDLNKILSQNNRCGRNTTNFPGVKIQYANKYGNDMKNLVQNTFQTCNLTRKRKSQSAPDRLPLRMIVTPLVWRDNPEKENYIDQIPDNSYGYYQRQTNGEDPFSPCQEKRRRTSGESFISHSQRILNRIRGEQLQASLNRRNKLHAKENQTDTENNTFSRIVNSKPELCSKNSSVQSSEIERILQTPMRNISLSSPNKQTHFNNTYRSNNNLSDSDESPSVLDKNTSFCENVLKERDRSLSTQLGDDRESFCECLVEKCGHNSSFNSEEQFQWNPVIMNSSAGVVDKQVKNEFDSLLQDRPNFIDNEIDQELDCLLQDKPNFIDNQIDQELDYIQQDGPNFENNHYQNNAECFNDFNDSDDSVLYNDSASSVNSNHSSNNTVKNCFQQCEEYWSRGGQVSLKTTYEESLSLTFSTEPQGVTPFVYSSEHILSSQEE